MREIKFRAWDKLNKRFTGSMPFYNLGIFDSPALAERFYESYELMQYIGLKDKNGVEIYEGDIFRQKGMDDELIIGTIIYYDDFLSYRCREGDYIFHKVKFAGEVIGNIYENQDLFILEN